MACASESFPVEMVASRFWAWPHGGEISAPPILQITSTAWKRWGGDHTVVTDRQRPLQLDYSRQFWEGHAHFCHMQGKGLYASVNHHCNYGC